MEIYTYSVLVPEQHINHFFKLFKKAEENGIIFDLELNDDNLIIFKQEDQREADIEHILYSSGIFEEDELENWKSRSSDWANMGNRNGRTYGYLN